jgi:uncharacterized protein (DUF362 family)
MTTDRPEDCSRFHCFNRRALLIGGGVAAAGVVGYPLVRQWLGARKPVFLAGKQRYDGPLARTIEEGLAAIEFDLAGLRGKSVLLKPNLVEPRRDAPHMTTHPAVVAAAAEVFLRYGAFVRVGEAPGHVRDTQMALVESGLADALAEERLDFVDLNYDDVAERTNRGFRSKLKSIFFARAAAEADLIVSLPKLKTHHWVGMTAAMKNLYGTLPGIKYGWPKNVLHHAGIPETVVDINASAPPTLGIVDAIECMEGDGPIMGEMKPLGMLAVGANLPALDATCARVMGLAPERIGYLQLAGELGPIADSRIVMRGERWRELHSPFEIIDEAYLQEMRS